MKINFKKFITESVVDIPRNTLDPTVFSFPESGLPVLQSAIKEQIIRDIQRLSSIFPISDFYIIGSILTRRYNENSDIDVNVELDSRGIIDELSTNTILKALKRVNGKLATGTTHPINYYIMREEYDLDKTDAAYDVLSDKWIKIPEESDDAELLDYLDDFEEAVARMDIITGELRRNVLDVESYKKLPTDKIYKLKELTEKKLRSIEDDINNLSIAKKELTDLRKIAFERDLSFEEIRDFVSRSWLPENVVYKLFSKYQYHRFVKKLEDFLEGNKPLEPEDMGKIRNIGKSIW
jgi:predicted nucleotidyltransferase